MTTFNDQTNSAFLNDLLANAFDFLGTAINEFDKKPKYSIIHFSTAVELFLKARLLEEHWALIVDGRPDVKKFKEGDFKSLAFKELIPTIESVLNLSIPNEAKKCFNSIADHRNKTVHFYHRVSKADKNAIQEVAIEQSRGWYHLKNFLQGWDVIVENFKGSVDLISSKMENHQVFLQTAFEILKPEIDNEIKKGVFFHECSGCSLESAREIELTKQLVTIKCKVCSLEEPLIKLTCPNCERENIWDHPHAELLCICGYIIGLEEINEQLNTNPATNDNYFDHFDINCAECHAEATVIEHNGFYICLSCMTIEKEMQVCDSCGDGQICGGNLQNSIQTGCEFC